jgi:hypothetical protein
VKALLALVAVLAAIGAAPAYGSGPTPQGYRFITDTLGGRRHLHSVQPQGYRFITDTLGGNGGPSAVTVPGPGGFDWGDAAIGASTAAGAIFVVLGTALLVRRRSELAV